VPKLAVEGNRFWSWFIITTIFLLGMVIKTQYPSRQQGIQTMAKRWIYHLLRVADS